MLYEGHDASTSVLDAGIGPRLRQIRGQLRMSLHDVQRQTQGEFKASVLGAYERGERAITVVRLHRLADVYGVPVDQLVTSTRPSAQEPDERVSIDLGKLSRLSGAGFESMMQFLRHIQVRREDFNGTVLTVRADDHRAMAAILGVEVDELGARLEALDLRYHAA